MMTELARTIAARMASIEGEDIDLQSEFENPVPVLGEVHSVAGQGYVDVEKWLLPSGVIVRHGIEERPVDAEERVKRQIDFWHLHRRNFIEERERLMLHVETLKGYDNAELAIAEFVNHQIPYAVAVVLTFLRYIEQQIALLESGEYEEPDNVLERIGAGMVPT
ncbi:MAG: hypothetical protein AB7U20_06905 [Planctomycetaceae bacterium]